MRKELVEIDMSCISFPDCRIEDFRIVDKTMHFKSDGVFIDGMGLIDAPVNILIRFGTVRARDYVDGNWSESDTASADGISQICEWKADSRGLVFAGFRAGSGAWSEFAISDVSFEISPSDQAAA